MMPLKGIFRGWGTMPPMAIHSSPGNILLDVTLVTHNCVLLGR